MMPLQHIHPHFVVLYSLYQSCLAVGPGDCNFLISSESFPTTLRRYSFDLWLLLEKLAILSVQLSQETF
jgi:hypothetical protein